MTRTDITLRGDDTEQFEAIREHFADKRMGNKPDRAETVRLLMQDFCESHPVGDVTRRR